MTVIVPGVSGDAVISLVSSAHMMCSKVGLRCNTFNSWPSCGQRKATAFVFTDYIMQIKYITSEQTNKLQLARSIDQFRYIKIQPKTIDLSTRLVGINTEFVGFNPRASYWGLLFKLNFNISKLIYWYLWFWTRVLKQCDANCRNKLNILIY